MKRLPEKLSDLIELALRDLRKVEKDERYLVDMAIWHTPDPEYDTCLVCFAGAVMAETLEMPIDKELFPFSAAIDVYTKDRLNALDLARTGDIGCALSNIGDFDETWNENVTSYGENPKAFHDEMKDIAIRLRMAGH